MDKIIDALLVLADNHYNEMIANLAIDRMIPAEMHWNGSEFTGDFKEYLNNLQVTYKTARHLIEKHAAELPESCTCGDCYYALAMALADYGMAIRGDMGTACKIAYGWLTDPDG